MKRYSLVFVVSVLLLLAASASFALVPVPDGRITLPMQQGWAFNNSVWYICTDTNDIKTACDFNLNLAPRLSSAIGNVPKVYIVLNSPSTQGPVFSATPVGPTALTYAGKWQVVYICFNLGFSRFVTNSQPASPSNPNGLPPVNQAVFTTTNIIVDYPIVAVGQLGGPWKSISSAAIYRIPEGISATLNPLTITLPTFNVFCCDPLTQKSMTAQIVITDVADPSIAAKIGANVAPGLRRIPHGDRQDFYIFGSPTNVATERPGQFPVIEDCPKPLGCRNTNFEYTPLMEILQLGGLGPCPPSVIPLSVRIFCEDTVEQFLTEGLLTQVNDFGPMNASVVGFL